MGTEERIDRLVAALYEAAAERERWPECLRLLAEHFSASVTQFAAARPSGFVVTDSFVHGADARDLERYISHYAPLDPRTANMIRLSGQVATYHDMVDDMPAFQRSEFYNDLLIPTDTQNGMNLLAGDGHTWFASIAVMGPREPTSEAVRTLEFLNQHFQRAMRISAQIGGLKSRLAARDQALDAVAGGVFFVRRDGHVVHLNKAAEALAARGHGLTVTQGRIGARYGPDRANLMALIAAVHETAVGRGRSSGGVLKIHTANGRALAVVATPLILADLETSDVPTVALFVRDPDAGMPATGGHILASAYGLTPAEARVAQAIVMGLSLTEIAQQNRISLHTVRGYLKLIFQKTETKRQSELVALLGHQISWFDPR